MENCMQPPSLPTARTWSWVLLAGGGYTCRIPLASPQTLPGAGIALVSVAPAIRLWLLCRGGWRHLWRHGWQRSKYLLEASSEVYSSRGWRLARGRSLWRSIPRSFLTRLSPGSPDSSRLPSVLCCPQRTGCEKRPAAVAGAFLSAAAYARRPGDILPSVGTYMRSTHSGSSLQALQCAVYYPIINCINTENHSGFSSCWGTRNKNQRRSYYRLYWTSFFKNCIPPTVDTRRCSPDRQPSKEAPPRLQVILSPNAW